jgi:catechol 2,3-dioxygenase-like lactoylglutathione lyase family enzyme
VDRRVRGGPLATRHAKPWLVPGGLREPGSGRPSDASPDERGERYSSKKGFPEVLGNANLIAFATTAKPDECRRFYREVLGLMYVGDDGKTLTFDSNGTAVRFQRVKEVPPGSRTVLGWEVPDLDHLARELGARGVAFERIPGLVQDRHGVWTSNDGTLMAWFRDPDGNLIALSEHTERP